MRLIVATGMAVLLTLSALPAAIAGGCRSRTYYTPSGTPYEVEVCEGAGESGTPASPSKRRSTRRYQASELIKVVGQVEGQPCSLWATRSSAQGVRAVVAEHDQSVVGPIFDTEVAEVWQGMVSALPACRGLGRPAEQAAFAFLYEYGTPDADPYIAPGFAITGKRAYLETRGPLELSPPPRQTELGELRVRFEATTFAVDWGDGTPPTEHASPGRPWPHGAAFHAYEDMGHYDVTVSQRWRATWELSGDSGELMLTGPLSVIEAFEVRQLQAVRIR